MNYHNITNCDVNNGDGLRVVLWVAGCLHHCKGCQNPLTWDPAGGLFFDDAAEKELFSYLEKDYIAGITFSGGDPLHPANRETIGRLIRKVKKEFPSKDIWVYTGYTFEEVKEMGLPFLKDIDVLVDGKYIEEKRDVSLEWVGSSNQKVIRLKK